MQDFQSYVKCLFDAASAVSGVQSGHVLTRLEGGPGIRYLNGQGRN